MNKPGKQFLQNAVAHSTDYHVKIVYIDTNTDPEKHNEVQQSFEQLERNFSNNSINIHLIDAAKLITDSKLKDLILTNPSTGVSIDLLKMFSGANLDALGVEEALIADFDVELPSQLTIDMCSSTVMPLFVKNQRYRVDCSGFMDHMIENGYCFVKGRCNPCYVGMLNKIRQISSDVGELGINDVYTVYVSSILGELTAHKAQGNALSDQALLQKYNEFKTLDQSIQRSSTGFTIEYERGNTWDSQTRKKLLKIKSMPLQLSTGSKPVYQREYRKLYLNVFYKSEQSPSSIKTGSIISQIDGWLARGFSINTPKLYWSNSLQRDCGVLELMADQLKGETLFEVCEYLLSKSAKLEDDLSTLIFSGKIRGKRPCGLAPYSDELRALFARYYPANQPPLRVRPKRRSTTLGVLSDSDCKTPLKRVRLG